MTVTRLCRSLRPRCCAAAGTGPQPARPYQAALLLAALLSPLAPAFTPALQTANAGVLPTYEIRRLGFTGPGYQDTSTGYEYSRALQLNDAGQVIGWTTRYNGASETGCAAWIDDGSGPTRLGFTGPGYQDTSTGYEYSRVRRLNDAGQVIGVSYRFNGSAFNGQTAWIDDGSGPTRLGFTGPGYQDTSTGYEYSSALQLNDAGQTVGASVRYDGASDTGWAAWIDDGSGPTRLGFTGPGYQDTSTGYESSGGGLLNAAGQVAGASKRYNGSSDTGWAAWIDDGSGPTRLGFTGPGYQDTSTGYESSRVRRLNDAGQVIGVSKRYNGSSDTGEAVWIDDGSGPTRLGFTGPGYQDTSTGYESSYPRHFNDAGQTVGTSTRYNGSASNGKAVWIDDGSGALRLGFTGTGYQRTSDGYEYSNPRRLNDAGQVVGVSHRYNGPTYNGLSGWFYDSLSDTLHELLFSQRSDGYGITNPTVLTDAGIVLGNYNLYAPDDSSERRLFAWDLVNGFVDLNDRVSNLSDDGWDSLLYVKAINDAGTFIGHGTLAGHGYHARYGQPGEAAFIAVPEPHAVALILGGLAVRLPRRQPSRA